MADAQDLHTAEGREMTTQVTDIGFIQRQLDRAVKARADAIRTITLAGEGYDYKWHLTALVRQETEVVLYRQALENPEAAAKTAVMLMTAPLGTSSTDPFNNEIARQKAAAAYDVLRFLSATGVGYETIGKLLVRV